MRTIETTVYTFDELTPKAKERARQWWREGFEYDGEDVIEDFKAIAALLGFKVDKVYWSGFSSQGDGASFTGEWSRDDCKPDAVKDYAPQDVRLHEIANCIQIAIDKFEPAPDRNERFDIVQSGRYVHAYTMRLESDGDNDEGFESAMLEFARDLANWLYRGLQAEYYHQQSDDVVDDTILANEYEFDADGDRIVIVRDT